MALRSIQQSVPLTAKGQQQLVSTRAAIFQKFNTDLANRHASRCNIVCVGDSITEGQGADSIDKRYTARLRDMLRAAMPTVNVIGGGRGFIPAITTGQTTYTAVGTAAGGVGAPNTGFGQKRGGNAVLTSAGQKVTFALVGTSADICYTRVSGTGVLYWSVDGGTQTTIDTHGASVLDGQLARVSLGASGAHSLEVGWSSGTNVFLSGVIEYNGDENAGIQVHDCGHFGYASANWIAGGASISGWPAAIAALNPSLIIIELGANDMNAGLTPTAFQANLTSLVALLRGGSGFPNPGPPILFLAYPARSGAFIYSWSQYINAIYAAAIADSLGAVFDLTLNSRMPNVSDAQNYGLYFDSVHPSNKGHSFIGDLLARYLIPQ